MENCGAIGAMLLILLGGARGCTVSACFLKKSEDDAGGGEGLSHAAGDADY
jgi:hypothetical protein